MFAFNHEQVPSAKPKRASVLAFVSNKGGVGKTTSAINVSAAIASAGQRVLLIDLDSQALASLGCGLSRPQLRPSIHDVLLEGLPLSSVIRNKVIHGLDLVTADIRLANFDLWVWDDCERHLRLTHALDLVRDQYDLIIMDSGPGFNLLKTNAIVAADAYIIPVTPTYHSAVGFVGTKEAIELIRGGVGTKAVLLGVLLTLVDYRFKLTDEFVKLIRRKFGSDIFETEIRQNVRLAEAPGHGKTIFEYNAMSSGATNYRDLSDEINQRIETRLSNLSPLSA